MQTLNIYVRQDLKMRKGKMAAQSAHAAMKLLFEVMKKTQNEMILHVEQKSQLDRFFEDNDIKIHMVQDENSLNNILDKNLPYSIIVDSGRTEFHGVPTVTCAAQGIFNNCSIEEMIVPNAYGKDIKAKQVFVFNKDFPLSKETTCELSVLTCLQLMYSKMKDGEHGKYFDLNEQGPFLDWITNAFGKIALSTQTLEQLELVEQQLITNDIKYIKNKLGNNTCLCIEPCYPTNIDSITGSLSLI